MKRQQTGSEKQTREERTRGKKREREKNLRQ
jgi:hypothetical protein